MVVPHGRNKEEEQYDGQDDEDGGMHFKCRISSGQVEYGECGEKRGEKYSAWIFHRHDASFPNEFECQEGQI